MKATDLTDHHVALQLFPGYSEQDAAILQDFAASELTPEPGFITDFLGCRIRCSSVWKEARRLDGQLSGIPLPGDFHAEAVEWIGLLKAVRDATGKYVAMELGAGFGPWIIAGAVAARRAGIQSFHLCAVEGDPQHFRSLRQHFLDNGFAPDEHLLIEAAVGAHAGVAQWPVLEDSSANEEWGLRPMESNQDYIGRQFNSMKQVNVVPMVDLIKMQPYWDLVHIDVQGGEVEICRSCVEELSARVRRIIVGTHSRKLDGDLLELMYGAGWILEHEKPAKFSFLPNVPSLEAMTIIDGTQVWRNPKLVTGNREDPLRSYSQEITTPTSGMNMQRGGTYPLTISVRNTGPQPWYRATARAPVNASYRWLDSRGTILPIEGSRTPLTLDALQPGESDSLILSVVAPPNAGSYTLWVSMVQEGVAWFFDKGGKPLDVPVSVA